jgi:heat-inducible transcriptional repressor
LFRAQDAFKKGEIADADLTRLTQYPTIFNKGVSTPTHRQAMELGLPQRTREVLHSIVQDYIESGEPIASRAIARRRKDGLSAATIRNIMADLADLGYLTQPHTSAGRVPTEKGFRHFAQSVVASRTLAIEMERLRKELHAIETTEARAERTSHLLTELTRNVSIVAAIPASTQTLDQIELVLLPEQRVLMVLVTRDGMVRNQVVKLDEPVTQDELVNIRNYVNRNFDGWVLTKIRVELERRLEQESAAYDHLLHQLELLYAKGLLDVQLTPQIYMEGASNLVGLDLHLTKEKLRDLFRTLEEKKRMLELLDRFLEAGSGEVQVQVGLAGAHPAMRELSLIGVTIVMSGGLATKMAVLGPMRMNYPRVISAVLNVGQALRSLPQ